jgi:hypothetical protein
MSHTEQVLAALTAFHNSPRDAIATCKASGTLRSLGADADLIRFWLQSVCCEADDFPAFLRLTTA